jgi:hypothetical protein
VKKLFFKRLVDVVIKHEVTKDDILSAYIENTYVTDRKQAMQTFERLKKKGSSITIYDIVACAKACNCTTDYLLGLSDRMN